MEKLDQRESLIIAARMFDHFGYDGKKFARKYLRYRHSSFINFIPCHRSFPNLWFPQRKEARFIEELYSGFVTFSHDSGSKYIHALKDVIIPNICGFFKKQGLDQIFAIAHWKKRTSYNFVLKINPNEIRSLIGKYDREAYFFNYNFSWLFVITQENFSFFAADRDNIESFKKYFKHYEKYDTEREMLLP